jgi:hypothetical protein
MTTATRRRRLAAAAAALSILALGGACSSSDSSDDAPASADQGVAEPVPGDGGDRDAVGGGSTGSKRDAALSYDQSADTPVLDGVGFAAEPANSAANPGDPAEASADSSGEEQKVISNGAVQLRSDDVGKAVFDVRNVVDKYAGEVEASSTETDDEGSALRARLQLRVPTAQFDNAMQDLGDVATLVASSGNTEDVTTEVLDRTIRIQVQRRSIDRISLLLDRATSIRDIVNIEAQLSQRQADLAVLEKEARYLDDQTAMATINVSVERTKDKKPAHHQDKDDSGFFAGLSSGWDGLTTFSEGLATVVGALLPWLVVAGVLAIPGLPLYRRLRRREVAPGASPAPAP